MEMSLSLEQEKKLLLENYSKAELDLFNFDCNHKLTF